MKAALFYGGRDIRVEEVPDPAPGPGEVLLRVAAAGVCGSDLHGYRRADAPRQTVGTMRGHELAGVVVALGPGVQALSVGDRVAVEPLHLLGCGVCRPCRQGHYEVCLQRGRDAAGRQRHSSGFAELDVAPATNCYRLPEGFSLEAGAILDVYSCAVHAAHLVPAGPTERVAVIGTGPIGLAVAEMYRALGAREVLVVGRRAAALARALAFGADRVVNGAGAEPVAAVRELTDGGADVVIEAVGGWGETLAQGLAMLAPNGALGVLGMFEGPQTLDVGLAMARQARIIWINSYGEWDGVPEFRIALEMALAGRLHPQAMITHRYPLDDIGAAFAAADDKAGSGALKVIVQP